MAVCMRYRGCILNSHYYRCDPYDSDFDNGYGDQMLSVLSLCIMIMKCHAIFMLTLYDPVSWY